ncbi:hypothetical protein [Symbiopectobacterium sp. RP]
MAVIIFKSVGYNGENVYTDEEVVSYAHFWCTGVSGGVAYPAD